MLLEEGSFYVYSSITNTEYFEFLLLKCLHKTRISTNFLVLVVGESTIEQISFYKHNLPRKLSWN
jgi:hypothetical protein